MVTAAKDKIADEVFALPFDAGLGLPVRIMDTHGRNPLNVAQGERKIPARTIFGFLAAAVFLVMVADSVQASRLKITNVTLQASEGQAGSVQFDIHWENGWRKAEGGDVLFRHDAAWIFFKVRPEGEAEWRHLVLKGTGINPLGYAIGTGLVVELLIPEDRVGLFVRRAADGAGETFAKGITVVCDRAASGLHGVKTAQIRTFGIEMAHVARGGFKVGSGGTGNGELCEGGGRRPFAIAGDDPIECGDAPGKLWGSSQTGRNSMGGPGTLPRAFPNGYNAFYCMKHHITQGQYAAFLNTLTRGQQSARCTATNTGSYMSAARGGSLVPLNRNTVHVSDAPGAPLPLVFASATPDYPCNWLSWVDVAAFIDWAGLRPMTELEYEKACRGPLEPAVDEFAWGGTEVNAQTGHVGVVGTGTEAPLPSGANCSCDELLDGPPRIGIFERAGVPRVATGASFWGIMDMSGGIWERAVTIGHEEGRTFTGLHGDGRLAVSGDADVPFWPSDRGAGAGFRGGNWFDARARASVSDRFWAAIPSIDRKKSHGGRAVRTASAR